MISLAMKFLLTSLLVSLVTLGIRGQLINDLNAANDFLAHYSTVASQVLSKYSEASWNFNTNITDVNQNIMLQEKLILDKFAQEVAANASTYNLTVMSEIMKREFIKIMDIGTAAEKNDTKLKRLSELESQLETIYSTAKGCLSLNECLPLEPDLTRLFATSRDYNRLLAAWKGWRDATGPKMKNMYTEFVTLSNDAVRNLGHADTGAYWRSWYDTPEFESDVQAIFDQLRPLYEQLHAFARRRLQAIYGKDKFPSTGHIPAHLLGNMWAQQWSSLVDEFMPYKGKPSLDVTNEMVRQGYTPVKIFQTADSFFQSLGMIKMPDTFWAKSMLEKPKDGRDVVCHASAWDFRNGVDFRVKQCTDITQEDLVTAHHEMGHVEYYLQYKHHPLPFRRGANPGFHEAVGDVISLSVQTPGHMKSIGLLSTVSNDTETDINFLMSMALQKIAFLPFGFLIDQWRWRVFSGDTKPEQYNEHWWNLRCRYQGVSPPVERSEADFDPGSKFHIPANTPYIRYFVSFVIQFQFHKALCDIAGYKGPLHRCDIYNSTAAGAALSQMLRLGSSKPWTDAMYMLTNQTKMDAQPLMNYFKPLLEYLRKENGNDYGWKPQCPTFQASHDHGGMIAGSITSIVILLVSLYLLI
uniref:Angiotensin-converting enzyme n=1 Tax=Arion vulgaris TaxID=1028688 RepID=A0A0B7B0W6_9EUPU